jgi:cytoskeletal protein CcmA (bactofilin family)
MWKKPDSPEPIVNSLPPTPTPPREAVSNTVPLVASAVVSTEKAVIGPSISVKGEITGAEDILVQGTVDGTLNLKLNIVTIGKSGRVSANVYGRIIHVEGEVTGDCFGTEQVIVHKSGSVRGNITAPRVSLEDGARLKGTIDTGTGTADSASTSAQTLDSKSDNKDSKQPQQIGKRETTSSTAAVL